jgi:hypothetical protein
LPAAIRSWREKLPLLNDRAHFNPNAQTVIKGRKPNDPDLEEALNDWCESLLAENISTTLYNMLTLLSLTSEVETRKRQKMGL